MARTANTKGHAKKAPRVGAHTIPANPVKLGATGANGTGAGKSTGAGKGSARSGSSAPSTREMRREIKDLTLEANIRISAYEQYIKENPDKASPKLEKRIERLKKNTEYYDPKKQQTVRPKGKQGRTLGTGYKNKTALELAKQLRDLRGFIRTDTDTPQAVQNIAAGRHKAYETFMTNYGDEVGSLTFEEYSTMMKTFSTVVDMFQNYGYEDRGNVLVEITAHAMKKKRTGEMFRIMRDYIKKTQYQDINVTRFYEDLIAEMRKADIL